MTPLSHNPPENPRPSLVRDDRLRARSGGLAIGPYLDDRNAYRARVVKPLRDKVEPVYVTPGSAAEKYTSSRFPHKRIRHVDNGLVPP